MSEFMPVVLIFVAGTLTPVLIARLFHWVWEFV